MNYVTMKTVFLFMFLSYFVINFILNFSVNSNITVHHIHNYLPLNPLKFFSALIFTAQFN